MATEGVIPADEARTPNPRRRNPDRGRQFDTAFSPDGKLKAVTKDRNVRIGDVKGGNEVAVTADGNATARTKYGVASWVYGEELGVREAMWFSPDSSKLAYYKFDESKVKDYYLAMSVLQTQDTLDVEAYPKAGAPNPISTLFVYDVASKKSVPINTGDFDGTGHYVYNVQWSPVSKEILFHRTNRRQNIMELCAADPDTGAVRVLVREESPDGWTDNSPSIQWLEKNGKKDGRFLWLSERSGYYNVFLYDQSGKPTRQLTNHEFEVVRVLGVDEKNGLVYYTARSEPDPYLVELWRVGLDGKGARRLTDPAFSHSVSLAPDLAHFVDVRQRIDTPPSTSLMSSDGDKLADLASSDTTKYDALGLRHVERIEYLALDGVTKLYGTLEFPSDFDPSKKYPLLVSVYGGPDSAGGDENQFRTPNALTEFGFLIANFDNRGTRGRGRAFKHALCGKLGIVEIDDQASGVKFLRGRPYVDGSRVGIWGTSYGGYSSAMAILRYPDVFQAASSSSPVTDWYNYDSTYTERYNNVPELNKDGYANGACAKYAANLKGALLLYFGTADNNVHPTNSYQLINALANANKSFDMAVGPDRGHSSVDGILHNKTYEYFIEHLILGAAKNPLEVAWKARSAKLKRGRA